MSLGNPQGLLFAEYDTLTQLFSQTFLYIFFLLQTQINLIFSSSSQVCRAWGERSDAREGTNITLSCKVKGYPLPTVTWEREGGQEISESKGRTSQGEDLNIVKVSRLHMGMYVCTATSTFYQGPAYQPVTRNIMLHVLCK
ncbi:hypothetical protein TNCT_648381 [Trichonephila clavata]|uniref:Ig-like domain-containing protein n=1 Tax=Trichonephila clavata TaxID=2740835 RepID=A0A8X6FG52_TRICU|nr:hypothetical protein TNCT_648381 [Trichonephila clavata]